MDESWRFRPIQSTICPVCSTSHYPFCPPPPSFINQTPYPHHLPPPLPLPTLHHPPSINHRTVHPLPPPPSPLPPPHFPNRFVVGDEFPDRDVLRKRMRVEDPNSLRFSWDDERRLSLIREHGMQDPAQIVDRSFNPTPSHQNFDNYRNFQERGDFYGGEYDSMRSSWQRLENERISSHDRPFYPNESSSYNLPNQAQYSQPGSYEMMLRVPNNEQENPCPPTYPKIGTFFEPRPPFFDEIRKPFEPYVSHMPYESNEYRMDSALMGRVHPSQMYPPLPPQPPLPPPPEPSPPPSQQVTMMMSVPPHMPSLVPTKDSTPFYPTPPTSQRSLDSPHLAQSIYYNEMHIHNQAGFASEELSSIHQTFSKEYREGREQTFSLRNSVKDKPTVIDACHLFRQPHRASRPDHIVIILRGLPGSGKSYLAKALRDLEVETGGNAPRIHAMDDYFMIEVEKVEDNEGSKSSGSSRGRKQITKKVIEYCYEPEMEEAYRSSMLKAFKKTLDEGNFTFIIVDDRNLRVADFAQFWAIAKRSGYEVYLLEAMYKDPTGCAARNVHGFTIEDIQKMADQWEEAPSLYLQLDIQSLFRGDNLNEQSIQEVDMDTDDTAYDVEETHRSLHREDSRIGEPKSLEHTLESGFVKIGERWNADDEEDEVKGVKELEDSKWSKDVDDDIGNSDGARGNLSALSGLIQAYGKGGKSVHWGDQVGKRGFSIGALKKHNSSSLIIGPGSGYNLISNPLQEDDALKATEKSNINESKRKFTEQLRAERESFKAVFDRRRQRIGGLWDVDE